MTNKFKEVENFLLGELFAFQEISQENNVHTVRVFFHKNNVICIGKLKEIIGEDNTVIEYILEDNKEFTDTEDFIEYVTFSDIYNII